MKDIAHRSSMAKSSQHPRPATGNCDNDIIVKRETKFKKVIDFDFEQFVL